MAKFSFKNEAEIKTLSNKIPEISQYIMAPGYKVNIQKSIVSLYTSNKHFEIRIKKKNFETAPKSKNLQD